MATRLPEAGFAPGATHPDPTLAPVPDMVRGPRPSEVAPAWLLAPEFRALSTARRAFALKGVPPATARTAEASARQIAYWTLYELGHALDEIERRAREGSPCVGRVRVSELGPGRVVIHIAIEGGPEPTSVAGSGETGGGA